MEKIKLEINWNEVKTLEDLIFLLSPLVKGDFEVTQEDFNKIPNKNLFIS